MMSLYGGKVESFKAHFTVVMIDDHGRYLKW